MHVAYGLKERDGGGLEFVNFILGMQKAALSSTRTYISPIPSLQKMIKQEPRVHIFARFLI